MPRTPASTRDTSIRTYRSRRDFSATPEPAPDAGRRNADTSAFVVQKHDARRLHWDFRLEHGGVLWSWAIPRGPSLDPADKRLAVRTEDHPLDYADFAGTIPEGQYGAGTVETWDRGTWEMQGTGAAAEALDAGELKFLLHGTRLHGRFVLVRLKTRPKDRAENWLLIKEHDEFEAAGVDAEVLERTVELRAARPSRKAKQVSKATPPRGAVSGAPIAGAVRAKLPDAVAPQLATAVESAPEGEAWLNELKFDGYRLLAIKGGPKTRLLTRNGHDWTARLPTIAAAVDGLAVQSAILDGELVSLREDGVSSFAQLQQALSDNSDRNLLFYAFDLLHRDGWDLRPCRLLDRKEALATLSEWRGSLRYSDHVAGDVDRVRRHACNLGLEGVVCKQADAPYRAGRGRSWLKVKCGDREEFIVIGFTEPAGRRSGLGSLHVGYRNPAGELEYVGGVGTGFTEKDLVALRPRLEKIVAGPPADLVYAGDKPEPGITWVRPELVAEVQFAGWSGSGRIRHATYLGLREDKAAAEVARPVADPAAKRVLFRGLRNAMVKAEKPRPAAAAAPRRRAAAKRIAAPAVAHAGAELGAVHLTHADRELWPGVTKRDLAEYWLAVAPHALPEIARRPLALVRCPEGIEGERFFQKHGRPGFPEEIRADAADGAPYLVVEGASGLLACAQVAAVELHAWGSREPDPAHADQVVFDLDPAEDVPWVETVRAALELRERLRAAGLESFCRTTGGKGLHVVAPIRPPTPAEWATTRAWCRAFAEAMVADQPDRFVSRVAKAEREGKILVDWLRNGLGSTAVASYSPRARPGATVATRVRWSEVTQGLDPKSFTLTTVPSRLAAQKDDPWAGFDAVEQSLPDAAASPGGAKPRRRR